VTDEAIGHLVSVAGGDARTALNALELAVATTPADPADGVVRVGLTEAEQSIQAPGPAVRPRGDEHYDTISAFIKSVRGSDPDAALYWLAKMVKAGEDPRFILRRLVILASETSGWPTRWPSSSPMRRRRPSSGSVFPKAPTPRRGDALPGDRAEEQQRKSLLRGRRPGRAGGADPGPLAPAGRQPRRRGLGHGKGYLYPHDFPGHHAAQHYLPDALRGTRLYEPGSEGYEAQVAERLERWRRAVETAAAASPAKGDAR